LAPRPGLAGVVPPMDPRPLRTMVDMGMKMQGAAGGMADMPGMEDMPDMPMAAPARDPADTKANNADGVDPGRLRGSPFVDNVSETAHDRLAEPGDGLQDN